jgi:hypothetical protein
MSPVPSSSPRLALLLAAAAAALVSAVPFGCGPQPAVDLVFAEAGAVDGALEEPASWELGANLVSARGCPTCHDSSDPATRLAGSDQPIAGSEAYGANLTPDPATGIGRWTDDQITAAILRGVAADGHTLCEQMPRAADMSAGDVAAIVTYLRSLPPVVHQVPASACAASSVTTTIGAPDDAGAGGDGSAGGTGGDGGPSDAGGLGTRGTPPPTPGALVVSEAMCDPLGPEPTDEWFELHNRSTAAVALRGLTLMDSDGRTAVVDAAPDLAPGGYALFVRTAEGATATALPAPAFVYGESLGASSGIVLTNDSKGSISVLVGDVLIDTFPYGASPRRASGASVERIEEPVDGGAIGCTAATPWAPDAGLGTPAAVNDCP